MLGKAKRMAQAAALEVFDSDTARQRALEPFSGMDRAQTGMNVRTGVALVVTLFVGALMASILLPIAIDEIVGVDTSAWDTSTQTLWDLLPVVIILSPVLFFVFAAIAYSRM